jgi:hypothetical protein
VSWIPLLGLFRTRLTITAVVLNLNPFFLLEGTDTCKEAFLARYQEATPLDAQLEQMPMLRPPVTTVSWIPLLGLFRTRLTITAVVLNLNPFFLLEDDPIGRQTCRSKKARVLIHAKRRSSHGIRRQLLSTHSSNKCFEPQSIFPFGG